LAGAAGWFAHNHSLSLHAEQSAYGISVMARIVSATLLAVISVAVAFAIEPVLTMIIIGLGLVVAVVVFGLDLQLYRLAGRNSAQLEELFAAFGRELDDVKAAKVASGSGKEAARFEEPCCALSRYRNEQAPHDGEDQPVPRDSRCPLAGWPGLGCNQQAAILTVGPMAVALIFVRLFPAMRSLQSSVRDLLVILPAWGRLSNVVAQAARHRDPSASGTGQAPQFEKTIELSKVPVCLSGQSRTCAAGYRLQHRARHRNGHHRIVWCRQNHVAGYHFRTARA
jgi:ABC-type multidrug transport system fused ATPase/permease subunit